MNGLSIAGFTNLGYLRHSRDHQHIAADMRGKTVVVTGATGGLGLAASRGLAKLGARVVIVGRNQHKLDRASDLVGSEVVTCTADLSLLSEVRRLANHLLAQEPQIDVLINNVGVLNPRRELTSEGLEKTFATNLAGHFLLTNSLAYRLAESAPARVINVTSGGMYSERIRPDDLQFESGDYGGAAAYARTKRGQVILTEMWAERLAESGIIVHSMHPGWAKTNGVKGSLPTFNKVMKPFLRTPEQGADTITWLAAAEEPAGSSGRFWFDRKSVPTHLVGSTKESSEDRERLWNALVTLTGSDLPLSTSLGAAS